MQTFWQQVRCGVNPHSVAGLGTRAERSGDETRDMDHLQARTTGVTANGEYRADGCFHGSFLPDFAPQGIGGLFAGRGPARDDPPRMTVPECVPEEEDPAVRPEQDSRDPDGEAREVSPATESVGEVPEGAQVTVAPRMLG